MNPPGGGRNRTYWILIPCLSKKAPHQYNEEKMKEGSGFTGETNENYNASHMSDTQEISCLNPIIFGCIIKFIIIRLLL